MTPLLCQEGLKQDLTQPNPMISSIQTLASFGLKGPLHLVLKGLFLLRTLRVSAGTHAADRTSDAPLHRTDELLIDGEIIGHEHNALLVVVTRKAPREVQRRCLKHVQLKVMEGVLSHVRKAKACGLVAQHEVRLLFHRPAPLISPQGQRQHLGHEDSRQRTTPRQAQVADVLFSLNETDVWPKFL